MPHPQQTVTAPQRRLPSNLITRYPGGLAWPAHDGRLGRYIMCPIRADLPFELGVVDDFGNLVRVPCAGINAVYPTTGMLAL